ncbi:MAG: hypothetical protein ACI4XQ_08245 [Eubacteriales bacterium]
MDTGFSTEEISKEKKTAFVSNINVSLLREEPEKSGILCFDVNEQEMIAVGNKDFQSKKICIYTSQGEFLYGYTFNCTQSFCVEWDEQHVNIYFIRSDLIISLDSDGNILDIKAVQDTIDNNSYRNSLLYSTTRTVGNTTYLIRNDMGILNWIAFSFSQIVAVDAAGTESVIYDVNSVQLAKMIVAVCFICVFVFVAVAVIARQFIKLKRGN